MVIAKILGSKSIVVLHSRSPGAVALRLCAEILILDPSCAIRPGFWGLLRGFLNRLDGNLSNSAIAKGVDQNLQRLLPKCTNLHALSKLESYLNQLGFFSNGAEVNEAFWALVFKQASLKMDSPKLQYLAVLGHLLRLKLVEANEALNRLSRTSLFQKGPEKFAELLWFAGILGCASDMRTSPQFGEWAQDFSAVVRNKMVHIKGPGCYVDKEHEGFGQDTVTFVTAVNGLGIKPFEMDDSLPESPSVLYWTPIVGQDRYAGLSFSQKRFLRSFDVTVTLNGNCEGTPGGLAGGTSLLRTGGLAHKAQVMALDALRYGAKTIVISGVDFYTGDSRYRTSVERSWVPESLQGWTKFPNYSWDVHQSYIHALHNGLTNRRLLVNLFSVGLVDGDSIFRQACTMTEEDYLRRLDELYGSDLTD